jgi:hypothetical protein
LDVGKSAVDQYSADEVGTHLISHSQASRGRKTETRNWTVLLNAASHDSVVSGVGGTIRCQKTSCSVSRNER